MAFAFFWFVNIIHLVIYQCKNDTEAVTLALTPSPFLLIGSADRGCSVKVTIKRYKKAHAVGSSYGAPLLELSSQVIILTNSRTFMLILTVK